MNDFYVVSENKDERNKVLEILNRIGFKWSQGEKITEYTPPNDAMYIHVFIDRKAIKFGRRNNNSSEEFAARHILEMPINYMLSEMKGVEPCGR